MMMTPTLIWTRSRTDWQGDQLLLAQRDFTVVHLPCLSFTSVKRPRQLSQLDELLGKGAPLAMVFTSAWGVRFAYENIYLRSPLQNATIYALGEGTANTLARYGLSCRYPKIPRGGRELGALLIKTCAPESVVLLPGGVERAFDLRLFLADHGLTALNIDLYQTSSGIDLLPEERGRLADVARLLVEAQAPLVVSFASPSAVAGFHREFAGILSHASPHLVALALGDTSALRCRQYFAQVVVPSKSTMEAMIAQAEVLLT